jgi:hypothetical protein
MPPKKSPSKKGSKSGSAAKKKPGRPKGAKNKKPKADRGEDTSDSAKKKKPGIYYEDWVGSDSMSDSSVGTAGSPRDSAPSRKKAKIQEDASNRKNSGAESPRTYDLFFGTPEVRANADQVKKSFTAEEEHVREMYAHDPVLQDKVYNCAVQNDFATPDTIINSEAGTKLLGTPGIAAATTRFLTARARVLTSGVTIESRFVKADVDELDGGFGPLVKKLAQFKNKEKSIAGLKLSSLGFDGTIERFPHFITCIFAALEGPIMDGASFGNVRNQIKTCCDPILEGRNKEFCFHFGGKVVEELWRLSGLPGPEFSRSVPTAVQLAFSHVNPTILASSKRAPSKKDSGAQKKKLTPEETDAMRRLPGFIPQEVFSGMSKEEIGQYFCPFQNYHITCTNSACKFSHDSTKPLYGKK